MERNNALAQGFKQFLTRFDEQQDLGPLLDGPLPMVDALNGAKDVGAGCKSRRNHGASYGLRGGRIRTGDIHQ